MLLDIINRVFNGGDFFGRVFRDFDAKSLFEGHHEFYRIQAVRAQIVNERGILGHLGLIDAQMLDNNFFNFVGDFSHSVHFPASGGGVGAGDRPHFKEKRVKFLA